MSQETTDKAQVAMFVAADKAREATKQYLESNSCEPQSLKETMNHVYDTAEIIASDVSQDDFSRKEIDCKKGCYHCCHQRVIVSPLELFRIRDYIYENFSANEIEELKKRVEEADAVTHGMSEDEHGAAGVWCPLLSKEGRCTVYEARPFECRGYVSTDVEECKKARQDYMNWNVPLDAVRFRIYKSIQTGLFAAFACKENFYQPLELTSAIMVVLSEQGSGDALSLEYALLQKNDWECMAALPWTSNFDYL